MEKNSAKTSHLNTEMMNHNGRKHIVRFDWQHCSKQEKGLYDCLEAKVDYVTNK